MKTAALCGALLLLLPAQVRAKPDPKKAAAAKKGKLSFKGSVEGQPQEGSPVKIKVDASGGKPPYSYYFDWNGDGRYEVADSNDSVVSFTFSTSGSHSVGLAVRDSLGKIVADKLSVVVANAPPQIKVSPGPPAPEGQPVSMTMTATDPGGDRIAYSIDWDNDGVFDEIDRQGGVATHVYNAPGIYGVVVRARDDEGAASTGVTALVVQAGRLNLVLDRKGTLAEGEKIELFARVNGPKVDPLRVDWDLGGGVHDVGERISRTFRPGDHDVVVTATDSAGRIGTARTRFSLPNAQPEITGVQIADAVEEGNDLQVTVSARDAGGPAAQLRYSFDWDGDGKFDTTSSDPTTTRVYRNRGLYTIGIKVVDADGGTAQTSRKVTVRRPEGGNLYVLQGFGTGGFVGITPYRTSDQPRTVQDGVPRLPKDKIPGYNIADRTVFEKWPWTMDIDIAYLLSRVIAASLRQTFAIEGGNHYSIQPGLEFWTPRRYVTTYARTALAIHRRPDLVGANLSLGMLIKPGVPYFGFRFELGIEPLFLGTLQPSSRDPSFTSASLSGKGIVLPVTAFFGIAANLF